MKYFKLFENYKSLKEHIFYHQTNTNNLSFDAGYAGNYKGYVFFSTEPQVFLTREWSYLCNLNIESFELFNVYKNLPTNNFNFENSFKKHEKEIVELLSNNIDYFYDVWEKGGVDSPGDVDWFIKEDGGKPLNRLDMLIFFLTEWNDSWVIIESDIFLNFITSKNYKGFLTIEEGIVSVAIKDISKVKIIQKKDT